MSDAPRFVASCLEHGITLYTGVPDSLLKPLQIAVARAVPHRQHIVAANEGTAVGTAIGHYLSTGAPALVYLQNSGLGNVVNPLLSLADPEVYGIPMVVVVGWRGRPGAPDEPQHVKQGRVTTDLLDALDLPWAVLPSQDAAADECLNRAVARAREGATPYLVLVPAGTFAPLDPDPAAPPQPPSLPSREEALIDLVAAIGGDAVVVSTTGMLSRELCGHRRRAGGGSRDLLTVGGMGHAASIALGLAAATPGREVWCLDGDGSLLMHLGGLAVIADHAPATYFHAVFNNGVHDSVGGQRTSIGVVDIPAAVTGLGYRTAVTAPLDDLAGAVEALRAGGGPALVEIRVRPGSRPDLARPDRSPADGKRQLMAALRPEPRAR